MTASPPSSRRSKKRAHIIAPSLQTFQLTKIGIAEAHIRTAVRLFFEGCHPVPVYVLASAAREILTTVGEKAGVETILHSLSKSKGVPVKTLIAQAHEFARFFKHADKDPTATITFKESEVDSVLALTTTSAALLAGCRSKLRSSRHGSGRWHGHVCLTHRFENSGL